jgi:hypothetical protein
MAIPENFFLAFLMATIAVVATILINSAILWGVLHIMKIKDNRYSKALKISAVSGTIMFVASQALIVLAYRTGMEESLMLIRLAAIPAVTMTVNYYLVNKAYTHRRALLIAVSWSIAGWLISNTVVSAMLITLLNSFVASKTLTATIT